MHTCQASFYAHFPKDSCKYLCTQSPALCPPDIYLLGGWNRCLLSIKTYTGDLSQSLYATQPTSTSPSYIRHKCLCPLVSMVLECMHRAGGTPALACYPSHVLIHVQAQTGTDMCSQKAHTPVSNNCIVGHLFLLHSPLGERHPNPNSTGNPLGVMAHLSS